MIVLWCSGHTLMYDRLKFCFFLFSVFFFVG